MRFYQNEKVLMREVGLIQEVKIHTVLEKVTPFEGTMKQIKAETYRQAHQSGAKYSYASKY